MTDHDSRFQMTSKGYIQGYNAQTFANKDQKEDQVIVAHDVANDANDIHQFKPMLDKAQANLSGVGVSAKNS